MFRASLVAYLATARRYLSGGNGDEFKPVYKFPHIRLFSAINKLKLYQTALTLGGVPTAIVLSQTGILDSDYVYNTGAVGVSGCILLYTAGYLTTRFAGFIYLNRRTDEVKISELDFWGRRKDYTVPLKDIVPLSELPIELTDTLYLPVKRFSTPGDYSKINLRFGQIVDRDGFNKIFVT